MVELDEPALRAELRMSARYDADPEVALAHDEWCDAKREQDEPRRRRRGTLQVRGGRTAKKVIIKSGGVGSLARKSRGQENILYDGKEKAWHSLSVLNILLTPVISPIDDEIP